MLAEIKVRIMKSIFDFFAFVTNSKNVRWKSPITMYAKRASRYVFSDKDKKYLDTAFLSDLQKEKTRSESLALRLGILNIGCLILLILAQRGLAPQITILNFRIEGIKKISELLLILSSTISLISVIESTKAKALDRVILECTPRVVPEKLWRAYYIKYSSSLFIIHDILKSLSANAHWLYEAPNATGRRSVLFRIKNVLHEHAHTLMFFTVMMYGAVYILFIFSVHATAILNVAEHPNFSLPLNLMAIAYTVVTDAVALLTSILVLFPSRYYDKARLAVLADKSISPTEHQIALQRYDRAREKEETLTDTTL